MDHLGKLRTEGQSEWAFVPLDLPPVNASLEIFDELCTEPGPSWQSYNFRYLKLRELNGNPEESTFANLLTRGGWDWNDTAREHFPDVIRYCDALPTIDLTYVSLLSAHMHIMPHIDSWTFNDTTHTTQPSHYRGLLAGATKECMYFTRGLLPDNVTDEEFEKADTTWLTLPEETNTFMMNSRDIYHGSIFRGPKITLFTCTFLDIPAHMDLMERSIRRFPNHVIRTEDV